jgi:hypothetical protein
MRSRYTDTALQYFGVFRRHLDFLPNPVGSGFLPDPVESGFFADSNFFSGLAISGPSKKLAMPTSDSFISRRIRNEI